MGHTGIDFSYLATGDLDNARWMRLEGSVTYHVIADSGTAEGHAFCRKSITGFVVGTTTEHVKRSTYGVMCERCRAKMAKVAATYAAQPVESATETTADSTQGESTQGDNTPRMDITQRQVSTYVRNATTHETTEIHATTYYYRRTINGTPYAFTFVLMRNGDRRHFVSKYNGYLRDSIEKGYATLENALRFGCAWSQVHAIIVRHPDDRCDRCGYCERNACDSHRLCYC